MSDNRVRIVSDPTPGNKMDGSMLFALKTHVYLCVAVDVDTDTVYAVNVTDPYGEQGVFEFEHDSYNVITNMGAPLAPGTMTLVQQTHQRLTNP